MYRNKRRYRGARLYSLAGLWRLIRAPHRFLMEMMGNDQNGLETCRNEFLLGRLLVDFHVLINSIVLCNYNQRALLKNMYIKEIQEAPLYIQAFNGNKRSYGALHSATFLNSMLPTLSMRKMNHALSQVNSSGG